VANQLADKGNCRSSIPDYKHTVTQEYNNDGTRNLIINLMLESDPAAMQGLDYINIRVSGYRRAITVPANQFVSNYVILIQLNLFHKFSCINVVSKNAFN